MTLGKRKSFTNQSDQLLNRDKANEDRANATFLDQIVNGLHITKNSVKALTFILRSSFEILNKSQQVSVKINRAVKKQFKEEYGED